MTFPLPATHRPGVFCLRAGAWGLVACLALPLAALADSGPYPDFYAVKGKDALRWTSPQDWNYASSDPLLGVEAEPDGSLLFAGGPHGAFLLKLKDKAWSVKWDWKSLGFRPGDLTSVTAAEKDPYGRVTLVLAAEGARKRVFLAEARSRQVKARWEYRLSLTPRRVRLCPDNGNFLVLSTEGNAWRLEEIDFRAGKTVWGFGAARGGLMPYDALRLKSGLTVLSDLHGGKVAAFNRQGKVVWVHAAAPVTAGPLTACPLAVEKVGERSVVLALPCAADGGAQVVRIDAATGEELGRWQWVERSGAKVPVLPADAISTPPHWFAR